MKESKKEKADNTIAVDNAGANVKTKREKSDTDKEEKKNRERTIRYENELCEIAGL